MPVYGYAQPRTAVNADVVSMLGEAVSLGARGMMFHGEMSLLGHKMGLQGQKRWHRYNAREDANYMMLVQHYALDMYDEILHGSEKPWDLSGVTDYRTFLQAYLDYENDAYSRLCSLNNRLVIAEKVNEARVVSKNLGCVQKEIEKIRRWMQFAEAVEWDMGDILIRDAILHDKYKGKESDQGWGE